MLAFLLGPVLFARQWQPWLGIPHERLIAIHLHLAAIGWLTLLIVTVGRTLVPMLALAPSEPTRRLPLGELSLIAGLWLAIAGFVVRQPATPRSRATRRPSPPSPTSQRCCLRAARRNRTEAIEGPIAHVLTGLVCLCEAAVLAGFLLGGGGGSGGVLFAYALLLLLGWAGGITLGHVGKLLSLSGLDLVAPRPASQASHALRARALDDRSRGIRARRRNSSPLSHSPRTPHSPEPVAHSSSRRALLALAGAVHTLRHAQPAA